MILFSLNDRDDLALVNLAGSFQDDTIPSKIQLGPAWWMQDHRDGMEKHMKLLANEGPIGTIYRNADGQQKLFELYAA